jgi:hypothetical protein
MLKIEITPEMISEMLTTDQKIKLVEVILGSFYDDVQVVSAGNSIVLKPDSRVDVLYYEED